MIVGNRDESKSIGRREDLYAAEKNQNHKYWRRSMGSRQEPKPAGIREDLQAAQKNQNPR